MQAHPDTMYLELSAALLGTSMDAAFTEAEVARLEQIVPKGDLQLPMPQLYEAFKSALTVVDPPEAWEVAFQATFGPYPPFAIEVLNARSKATVSSASREVKQRLGAVLTTLGRKLLKRSSLIDLQIGRLFLRLGIELTGDAGIRAEADAAKREFEEMYRRASVFKFVGGWPIAPLTRQLDDRIIRNELGLLRAVSAYHDG